MHDLYTAGRTHGETGDQEDDGQEGCSPAEEAAAAAG